MGPTALLPPPSVGLEPATEYPVGSVASTQTIRPPRASMKRGREEEREKKNDGMKVPHVCIMNETE
jgi:hypothetical protein